MTAVSMQNGQHILENADMSVNLEKNHPRRVCNYATVVLISINIQKLGWLVL